MVKVVTSSAPDEEGRAQSMARSADLGPWMEFLETRVAGGEAGLRAILDPGRVRGAGRVFLIGDLFDLAPTDVLQLVSRARELFVAQLLAPDELEPPAGGPVEWVDPESGARRRVDVDRARVSEYERELEGALERWRIVSARHRIAFASHSTVVAFEDVVRELLES